MVPRTIQCGFTMIEFAIALAIIGILLATGIPAMTDWVANSRIRSTADSIAGGLQLARAEAVRSNSRIAFRLNGSKGAWQVLREVVVSGELSNCTFAVSGSNPSAIVQSNVVNAGNNSVSINTYSDTSAATATDAIIFVFGANGWQGCTSLPQFAAINVDTSVLSAADSRDLRVVAPRGGSVRTCDPNVTDTDVRACP